MQKIQELTQQDKDRFMEILKDYIQAINQAMDNKEAMPSLEKWKEQLDSILQKINLEVIFSGSNNLIQNQVNFFRKDFDEEKYPYKFDSGPCIILCCPLDNQDLRLFFLVSYYTPNKNFPTYKGPSKEFFKKEKIFRKEQVYKNQSIFSQKFLDDFLEYSKAFNSLEIDDFGAIDDASYVYYHVLLPQTYILDFASIKNHDYFETIDKLFENPDFAKKNQHIKVQCHESDGDYFYIFTDSDYQNLYFAIKEKTTQKPLSINRRNLHRLFKNGGVPKRKKYTNDLIKHFREHSKYFFHLE